MRKTFIFFLVLIFSLTSFASAIEEDLWEEIIFLRVNRRFGDTFFPVYFGGDGREVYVEINEVLDILEEDSLIYDADKGSIEGELTYRNSHNREQLDRSLFKINLDEINTTIIDEKVYVEAEVLSSLLPLEYVFWDRDKYMLDIGTRFVLPIEAREIQERNRNNLLNGSSTKDEDIEILRSEKKLFTPGVVQVKYYSSDFSDRDAKDTLELNYYNQFLYGDFTYQGNVAPDLEKKYVELKYNEFVGNKALIIGDRSLQRESYFTTSSKGFQGISIMDSDIVIEENANTATIEGQVLNGTTVELYQRNTMIDFQEVRTSNTFTFEDITLIGFSEEYILKFYYPDGSYEEKVVILMKDRDLQNKGESDYRIQVGSLDDELAFSTHYLYGVTDNLTLGGGLFRSRSSENYVNNEQITFENIEADMIYRGRGGRNPAIYSLKLFTDLNGIDDKTLENEKSSNITYKGNIAKKFYNYDLQLDYEEYSNVVAQGRNSFRKYGVNIANNKNNLSHSIDLERNEEFRGNKDRLTLNLRYSFSNNLRVTWNNTYEVEDREIKRDKIITRFDINYSGFSAVNLGVKVGAEFTDTDTTESFEVNVRKRNRNSGRGNLDYSLSTGLQNEEWYFRGSIKYYFTDWLSTPTTISDSDIEVGLEIDKTINLARPTNRSSNPSPDTAWIEGVLFIDENGNGKLDKGEEILSDVQVIRGLKNGITDENGYFYLDGIPSNDIYEFRINSSSIDPMLKPITEQYNLLLSPSSGYRLEVPLLPVSAIMGDIYLKDLDHLSERERANVLQRVKVFLRDENGIVQEDFSEMDGFFLLEDVLPGKYYLEIAYLGNGEYDVDNSIYSIDISIEEAGEFYEGYEFFINPKIESEEYFEESIS